jgi:hypothetical protein
VVFQVAEMLSDSLLLSDVVFRIVGMLSDVMLLAGVVVFCSNVEYLKSVLASFVVVYFITSVFADSAAPVVQQEIIISY